MAKTAIALGTFDGVHLGHKSVINAAVGSGLRAVAVAFPEPPKSIISGEKNLLTGPYKKKQMLEKEGISEVLYLNFNEIKDISPTEFLNFLKDRLNAAVICCGFNYRFGKNGEGDASLIADFCEKNGIEFKKVEPVKMDGVTVSSSLIRDLLQNGDVEWANSLLGEEFGFSGEIVHGDMRGRTIGFPTLNQFYPENLVKVRFGVYSSSVTVSGNTYKSITNIGIRPTFQSEKIMAETYILDFSGDLYGRMLEVKLHKFIRPEQKFHNLTELKENIENDIEKAR